MAEYTLLKLQVDDATFTARAPFSGAGESGADSGRDGSADGDSDDTERGDGESDRKLFAMVAGLVFLVVVAVVIRKLRDNGGP